MTDEPVGEAVAPESPAGLTDARLISLERFPVRFRDRGVTQSGWRLLATARQGDGAIVLVEPSRAESYYRGEGVFLGWPQEKLAAAYEALLPRAEGPAFEMNQLG